jgi:hypothetical protein
MNLATKSDTGSRRTIEQQRARHGIQPLLVSTPWEEKMPTKKTTKKSGAKKGGAKPGGAKKAGKKRWRPKKYLR